MAAAYRHGADSRLPGDAGAPGVHAVSLRAVVLALHLRSGGALRRGARRLARHQTHPALPPAAPGRLRPGAVRDRKSTRLNSSHGYISYAVFCLKKKTRIDYRVL